MTQKQVKTTTLSEILDSWRYKPWLMLGIGFYFAFSLSVVVNCPQLIIDKDPSYSILFVRVAFSATVSLGLIVIMFLIHRFDVLNSGKWVIVFSASSTSLGTVLLILALNFVDSIELMITATSLVGLGNAVLLLSWGALFQKLSINRLAGHDTFSGLFAAVSSAIIHILPWPAYFTVIVCLPIASAVILIFCTDEQCLGTTPEVTWQNGFTKILVSCIIMGLTCGMLRVLAVFGNTAAQNSEFIYLVMAVMFVVNALLLILFGRSAPILFLYRFSVPVFIIGYGLLVLNIAIANIISIACVLGGSILFECLILLIFPYVAIRAKGSTIHVFGWCAVAQHAGSYLGFILGDIFGVKNITNSAEIAIFSLLAVIAFVVLFFFIFKELNVNNLSQKSSESGELVHTTDQRIDYLIDLCKFSPREAEVFRLLAKGRSLPYIEEELVISHSTARTHVKHIYEKAGISSRQELHDLIENSVNSLH